VKVVQGRGVGGGDREHQSNCIYMGLPTFSAQLTMHSFMMEDSSYIDGM